MPRKDINNVFDAESVTIHSLFMSEGGVAGLQIPIYQRTYDWDRINIQRFFEDALLGMIGLATDPDSLTFIGTIILVLEDTMKEKHFDGRSLSIIDGQQRLTTISLIACVLHEEINSELALLPKIADDIKSWIEEESRYVNSRLLNCAFGHIPVGGLEFTPFPRIVREQIDLRGNNPTDSEYKSPIASFLNDFSKKIANKTKTCFEYHPRSKTPEVQRFIENFKSITEFIQTVSGNREASDISIDLPIAEVFERQGYRNIFCRLPIEQRAADKIISAISQDKDNLVLGIIRLLIFAEYIMDCVIVTRVKTRNEKYAFDIFDALNTTGEPLTAIETFKPIVVKFENKQKGYSSSPSENKMLVIERYLGNFKSSDSMQKEAKDLILSFALYLTGEKTSRSLNEQRRYLRKNFERVNGESQRRFISHLAEIATYKDNFWSKNLAAQLPTSSERELLLVCLQFLIDLNNSLVIPILCRYLIESQKVGDEQLFANAIKAITAFIVLRRGATGGTAGIDSDLRGLMFFGSKIKTGSVPLCLGLKKSNELIKIKTFKEYLRHWLIAPKIGIENKNIWVRKVSVQPLYIASKPLCRFILLAAAHNARPDKNEPWQLIKVKESPELDYLSYRRWNSNELATIEHIAPDSPSSSGWEDSIYAQPYLKDCLGNLTLLPKEQNSAVGNASWLKKKKFYQAFSAETAGEVEIIINKAKKDGVSFGEKTAEMLKKQFQLPIAKTIAAADQWTREIIEKRSINLAKIAWDEINPWLFEH